MPHVSDAAVVFSILGALVVLFVWNRFPVELVALGAALTLVATGVLDLDQSLAGFGDPTVLLIASLFVVSEGLDATGVTTWAGQQLVDRAGESPTRLVMAMMALVALLSALVTPNGSVAALLPMVVVVAVRLGRSPSQLLMPLAFGAHAGSLLVLTGSPVNVFVSEAAADVGVGRFTFFEFALVGVPLVIGSIVVVVVLGPRLLPSRTPTSLPPDLSSHARTLGLQYLGDHRVFRLEVHEDSSVVGESPATTDLGGHPECTLVGVQVGGEGLPVEPEVIGVDDVLIVRGELEAVVEVAADAHLGFSNEPFELAVDEAVLSRRLGVAEVLVPPRSPLVGASVFPGMVTESGDLVVLAVQRQGHDLGPRASRLAPGDVLLLQGTWERLGHHIDGGRDVVPVDSPEVVRRQALAMGPRSTVAVTILVAMVVLLATGVVAPVTAGLLAAGSMVLTRVLTVEQAYRGVSWTTVVLVASMIPLSTAMRETGAAAQIADRLVDVVGDAGPYALLLGLFVLTAVLGQLISNMATVLVVLPVALSAATELDVSARPVLMTVTVAAAAALMTPVATPANLMVMGPGDYRFTDYWKLGLPLLVLYGVVAVLWVPVIWRF